MKRNAISGLVLSLMAAGCGGGGSPTPSTPPGPTNTSDQQHAPPTEPVVALSACTGNPWLPMCNGQSIVFNTSVITAAHLEAGIGLVVDASGPVNPIKTQVTYSQGQCGTEQVFQQNFGSVNQPLDPSQHIGDGIFKQGGVEYIGEFYGPNHFLDTGEPLITSQPVVGETIHTEFTIATTCGGKQEPLDLICDYYTIAHLDSFHGYSDVVVTLLVESHKDGSQNLFGYWFAKGIGPVQQACWGVGYAEGLTPPCAALEVV